MEHLYMNLYKQTATEIEGWMDRYAEKGTGGGGGGIRYTRLNLVVNSLSAKQCLINYQSS